MANTFGEAGLEGDIDRFFGHAYGRVVVAGNGVRRFQRGLQQILGGDHPCHQTRRLGFMHVDGSAGQHQVIACETRYTACGEVTSEFYVEAQATLGRRDANPVWPSYYTQEAYRGIRRLLGDLKLPVTLRREG